MPRRGKSKGNIWTDNPLTLEQTVEMVIAERLAFFTADVLDFAYKRRVCRITTNKKGYDLRGVSIYFRRLEAAKTCLKVRNLTLVVSAKLTHPASEWSREFKSTREYNRWINTPEGNMIRHSSPTWSLELHC